MLHEMAESTWRILNAWAVFEVQPNEKDFQRFARSIDHYFEHYVKAYRLCGYSNICLDEAHKTEWAPAADSLEPSPRDFVYHLFPGKGLEFFLDGLVKAAADSVKDQIKPLLFEDVHSMMKTAFRAVLGQYVYSNPLCGKTELCVYSSSSPQKVLSRSLRG